MNKKLIYYLSAIFIFATLIWISLYRGSAIYAPVSLPSDAHIVNPAEGRSGAFNGLLANMQHILPTMILQIVLIMMVSRIFGAVFRKLKQPSVIGEIIGGIVLGPSVLGFFFPSISHAIFPAVSLQFLQFFSNMGLILFMFIIGMELDINILMKKALTAVAISHTTIIFTFFLGIIAATYLYAGFVPSDIKFSSFALFMGISMSITAFPVLARIVQEKDIAHSPMGRLILTCAAVDDLTAWCLLAIIIAITKAGIISSAIWTIFYSFLFVAVMIFVVRPILTTYGRRRMFNGDSVNRSFVVTALSVLFFSAYTTEIIGIHTLFGSFMAGVVMPHDKRFKKIMTEKFEDTAVLLFLPLFFVYTGLRTQLTLLNDWHLWVVCIGIVCTAVIGKVGASTISARFYGQTWRNSLSIGVLMNTRGLMELVVLNIAYDLGVFPPKVFAMMVVMALSTTLMTGPGLQMIERFFDKKDNEEKLPKGRKDHVLISFSVPEMGVSLLQLSHLLLKDENSESDYSALHIKPNDQYHTHGNEIQENAIFERMHRLSESLGIDVSTRFKVTVEVKKEIVATVKKGNYNLLVLGGSKPLYGDDPMSKTIKHVLEKCDCRVAIYTNRILQNITNVVTVVSSEADLFLLNYADNISKNANASHTVIKRNYKGDQSEFMYMQYTFAEPKMKEVKRLFEIPDMKLYDIIVVSINFWEEIEQMNTDLKSSKKLLIFKDYVEDFVQD